MQAVYFCCTFPGVASAGRYPAPCPMELGLSSCGQTRTQPLGLLVKNKLLLCVKDPAAVLTFNEPCARRNAFHRSGGKGHVAAAALVVFHLGHGGCMMRFYRIIFFQKYRIHCRAAFLRCRLRLSLIHISMWACISAAERSLRQRAAMMVWCCAGSTHPAMGTGTSLGA